MITGRVTDRNGSAAAGLIVEAWARPSTLAHQSSLVTGMHQHYFEGASQPLEIWPGEVLVAYIFLDPVNPPREVMLQWNDGSWKHRAFWGEDLIDWGVSETVSRQPMGSLPPAGQWVRLETRAALVALEGQMVYGMAFTLFDGRATWDHAGKAVQPGLSPAEDIVWVEDALPEGAIERSDHEGWEWISANPLPFSGPGTLQLASTVIDDQGLFELAVDDGQLADIFQDRLAMVYFRVRQEDRVLASTENTVVWRADSPGEVAIEVELPPVVAQPSEYERLRLQVDPLLGERELAELTGDQVRQFAETHGIVAAHLSDLWGAVRLGGETDLPLEVLYGLLRRDLPRDLDRLLQRPLDEIGAVLQEAIAQNIVPLQLRDSLPDLMHRFGRLQVEHAPLFKLVEISEVAMPADLVAFLDDKRIRTLSDIRRAGGIRHLAGLPVRPDDPAVRILEAHANLSILPTDVQTNVQFIARGYTSPVAIASRTPAEFITSVAGALGVARAGQLYRVARAQTALLSNTLAGLRADQANGYFRLEELKEPTSRPCECKDCRAAVSPGAYLADLMDYTLKHLKEHLVFSGDIALVSSAPGRRDIFARKPDNTLWYRWFDPNSGEDWIELAGGSAMAGDPCVVSWTPGRMDVFLRGTGDQLWHWWYDGGTWLGWESLDTALASNPAVAAWEPWRLDLFVRKNDQGLWHRFYDAVAGWSIESVPDTPEFMSDPTVIAREPGRLDVFITSVDGTVWRRTYVHDLSLPYPDRWMLWEEVGQGIDSNCSPVVETWAFERLDLFIRSGDVLLHKWYNEGAVAWTEWEELDYDAGSTPAVVATGFGLERRLDLFVRKNDNSLWHGTFDTQGAVYWEHLEGEVTSSPAALAIDSPQIDLFMRGAEDAVWYGVYDKVDDETGFLSPLQNYAISAIDLQFLIDTFHQPFDNLPLSCEAMETQVRQVRLCIEVLWRYLDVIWPTVPQSRRTALAQAEASYLLEAYQRLLVMMGTSYNEIRLIRSATSDEQSALTDRLGIDLLVNGVNTLNELFLAPAAIAPQKLEELFGLVDTDPRRRDPLAPGQPSKMQTWRLRHLRTLWHAQDWPSDPYSEGKLPVIDPDVVTPDDFRNPVAKANVNDPDQPFDLWLKRRDWVDARLAVFAGLLKNARGQQAPDLETILQRMYQNVTYEGTSLAAWTQPPLAGLNGLLLDLRSSDTEVAQTAAETIQTNLRLPVEAFTRLMDIREKATRWERSQSDDAVTAAEWSEVYSILTQAQKVAFFPTWVREETQWQTGIDRVLFSPQFFWPSLREPQEGDWSSTLPSPRLDPELIRLNDLWEPAVRDAALRPADPARDRTLQLWQERQQALANIRSALQIEYETNSFNAMLGRALGHPNPGDALAYDLDDLKNDLDSGDDEDVEQATSDIENGLYMSVDNFNRLMLVRLKVNNNRKPTKADMEAVYTILTTAEKRKRRRGTWTNEENAANTGVRYWQALKARLPRWRATSEAREAWRQALSLRSQPSLIDPDVIDAGHLRTRTGDAYTLWESRAEDITDQIADLGTNPKTLAGLESILVAVVGIGEETLGKLAEKRDQGESVAAQLAQLNLAMAAFVYLGRIRALLAANQPILDDEWESVYSILTQVWKQRQFADWRAEEEAAGIILSQDTFQIPEIHVTTFPPPPPPELPVWRATWRARQDWEDTLQSRIELEETILEALRQAVSETEEAVLPRLRDALVLATDAAGKDLAEKARWITGRLLIDAQMDGCQMTTRIAQAIETLLNLLWSARLGQLDDLGVALTLDAPNFDQEWRWIGSYATWRAAMFVFMYPDNLLLPSLKRQQTPAFRNLVNELRNGRRLTPERACQLARNYSDYLRDVCNLTIEATCHTRARWYTDTAPCGDQSTFGDVELFFMFARSSISGRVYWSAYYPSDGSGYAQMPWEEVTDINDVVKLVGAVPYVQSPEKRYICLFAIAKEDQSQKLLLTKRNLIAGQWDQKSKSLDPPKGIGEFNVIVMQSSGDTAPPLVALSLNDGMVFLRRLNSDASDLETPEWSLAHYRDYNNVNRSQCVACLEGQNGDFYVIQSNNRNGSLKYRLFGSKDDGQWRSFSQPAGIEGAGPFYTFYGSFIWPGTSELYVFWREGNRILYQVVRNSNLGEREINNLEGFDLWIHSLLHNLLTRDVEYVNNSV
jgi:hypothetical protein